MTLQGCLCGKVYLVDTVCLNPDLSRRLHMLGLTKGTDITVLRKKRCGSMIIRVRGVRYAIGKVCAAGIFVEEAAK